MTSNARHNEHVRLAPHRSPDPQTFTNTPPTSRVRTRHITWVVAACACLTAFAVKISQQWLLWADATNAYADLTATFDWAAIVLCICALALVAFQSLPTTPHISEPQHVADETQDKHVQRPNIALPAPNDARLRLAQSLSHELRTPLNAVIGFSDLMNHELHGNLGHPKYNEYCAHITASSHSLLRAVDDILALNTDHDSTLQQRVPLPVAEALASAWNKNRVMDQHKDQPTALEIIGDDHSLVIADPEMLTHALANLVKTLKRHAASNTTISATIRHDEGTTRITCTASIDERKMVETAPLTTVTTRTGGFERISRDSLAEVAAESLVRNMGGQLTVRQPEGTRNLEVICELPAPHNENIRGSRHFNAA